MGFIRNAEANTQNRSVCMRWDVSLFCSAKYCGRTEESRRHGADLESPGFEDMHDPGYLLLRIHLFPEVG
jgi:hypothetical protein